MNDVERNRTVNWIVTITIGLLVALLVGALFGFLAAKHHALKTLRLDRDGGVHTLALAPATDLFIQFTPPAIGTDVNNCMQYDGGPPGNGGILYARPDLSKSGGDNAIWHGPIPSDVVTVTFDNVGPYGPFAGNTYATPTSSGAPTGGQSDYSFKTLTVTRGANTYNCTNAQGMGVHIDK